MTNKILKMLLSFLVFNLLINCAGRTGENKKDTTLIIENNNQISKDTLLQQTQEIDTLLKGDEVHEYSSYRLKTIAKRSESDFLMLIEKNNTLSICCAWDKFSHIFGGLDKDKLLSRYDFLKLKEEKYTPIDGEQEQLVRKYYFNKSFFKTYYYPYKQEDVIVCAKILDEEFVLRHKIQIGMKKHTFFELMFDKSDIDYLMHFDTINIGEDEMGELEYYYIFQDNNLKSIIIDTDFDWIEKDL